MQSPFTKKRLSRAALPRLLATAMIPLVGMGLVSTKASADQTPPANENLVHLPATSIFGIEKNGKFAVITDTGRFIIEGTVYDTWNQKHIETLDQARWAASHIPLNNTNIGFDDLQPISVGRGDKRITLFSDMACTFCKDIIAEARASLPEEYRLDILLLPLLSQASANRTLQIHCAADQAKAWKAAVEGDMTTGLEQMPAGECDLDVVDRRQVTAQFIGARNVPYLIRDDGLVNQGKPTQGFLPWVLGNR